jgi:hypothetical protein
MVDKIRVRFFGNGVDRDPTGHLYLRWLPEHIWRLSIWDSVSNERTSQEGQFRLDGGEIFHTKLKDAYLGWFSAQQKATDEFRLSAGEFHPDHLGHFQKLPMKARTAWTKHMNAVKLTQISLQAEVATAQHSLFSGKWHNDPYFLIPSIEFGYPWKTQ